MALQLEGQNGTVVQADATHAAWRTSLRPLEVGANGAYMLAGITGSIAATLGANSDLFGIRWTDAAKKLVLHELSLAAYVDASVTTSLVNYLAAYIARTWTAAFSGVNTALTPSKMMAAHAASAADAEIATTGAMTGSTKTVDAAPFAQSTPYATGTTAPSFALAWQTIYRNTPGQEHPVVLGQNEGIVIRNPFAGPATGTFRVLVRASWSEVAAYSAS